MLEDRRLLAVQDLSSFPAEYTGFGSDVVFTAQNTDGYELWRYDGSNVSQIANINPTGSSLPSELTVVGNELYFVASDGGGEEFDLWKYDGSTATKVLDHTGLAPINPANLTVVGSTLFFVAEDATNGRELWKTNGTAAGTVMVKDISPADSAFDGPDKLVDVDGTLYFTAFDADNGWELWKSDGTDLGTEIVADINPGSEGSLPQELTAVGSTLYFRADDGTNGEELWVLSGASPPELVKDISATGPAHPRYLTAVGGNLFFSTQDDAADSLLIWVSDGTEVGTQVAATLHVGDGWDTGALVEVDGDLYFSAVATDERDGWELWKIDGTTLDSTLLATFADWGQWLDPRTLTEAGDRLYFASFDGTYGHELWTSDGTVVGTKRLTDINLQVGNSSPQFLTDINGVLYFAANNSVIGFEPYSYDRTGLGLRLISNIAGPIATPEVHVSLAFDSDSGYENNDAITRVTTPTFVVDVNMPGQVQIDYNDDGVFEFSQSVSNWGTYKFAPTSALANGERTVTVRFTANSVVAEDETTITVDTVGPSLIDGYPVIGTQTEFYSLFFSESINEDRIFTGDFLLSGPGIVTPISLSEFFIDPAADRIDVGFTPLATPGIYTISVNNGLEDRAGNLLNPASPSSVSFEVLADAIFLDDPAQNYVWDPAYEGKDLVVDSTTLVVSGTHNLSSLRLFNGAQIVPVAGQALELTVAGQVVIDVTSGIMGGGLGHAGGAISTIGGGSGGGATGADGGGGGGYGGAGGAGGSAATSAGGIANGSDTTPVDLGSGGGGSAASTGGAGGGAVKLDIGGALILDGAISMSGASGIGSDASGGAGGSIWIIAEAIAGDGFLGADGANAIGLGGAGGGGRVSVNVADNQFTGDVSAAGGVGTDPARNGADGTIVASLAFPGAGADGGALAAGAVMPGQRVRSKNAVQKNAKVKQSDRGSEAVRESNSKESGKKTAITIKNMPPGGYQVRYSGQISRQRSLPVSLSQSFGTATRTGVPRTLAFAVSTQPQFTPTMTWDGGGDGVNWTSALNWSTDVVPSAGDTVYIPAGISGSVTMTGTHSVRALFSAANFVLSGSLTVGELSELTGTFTMTAGASLTASGPQASFEATGATVINGANLFANNGGEVSLPGVVSYSHAATGSVQTRTWQASGPGSRLSLPNLVSVFNSDVFIGGGPNANVQIQAFSGGVIDLSQVAEIADLLVDTRGNRFSLTADGLGSLIDLSALSQVIDRNSSALSTIIVTNGGEIRAPLLTTVRATSLVLDRTGIFSVAPLVSFTEGRLTLSGLNVPGTEFAFTALSDITRTTVDVDGVDVALGGVTNADGASFLVQGGVALTLPGVVSYSHAASGNTQTRTWRASGPGSLLSLPNLVTILNNNTDFGGSPDSDILIQALNGGVADLSQVAQMADPIGGDTGGNQFLLTADGLASLIDLSALTQLIDRNSGALSTITSSNGGEIRIPQLTTLRATSLTLDKTGILPIAQIASFTEGRLTLSGLNAAGTEFAFTALSDITRTTVDVDGVDVALGGVTNADGASFLVQGGVALTLPGVVSYSHAASGNTQTRTWRASGPGSLLSLPNLVTILNNNTDFGGSPDSDILIQALNGGVADLSQVAQMADPIGGDTGGNQFLLTADGLSSVIDLSALTQLIDRNSNALSIITVSNNALVITGSGNPVPLQNLTITLSSGAVISGSLSLTTSGSLLGAGTITGDVTSAVTINPAGTITFGGDYTQTQSGILAVDISGHQPTDADKLVVGGTANLNGQLQITRTNGTIPVPGDNYPILTYANVENDFSLKAGLDLGNLKVLKPVFGASSLTLVTTATSGVGVFVDSGLAIGPSTGGASTGREVRLGDVNNDGDLDALVSSDGSASTNPLWVNNGAGVFTNGAGFPTTIVGPALALGDIDNDNDLDVVAGFGPGQALRAYRNQGGLQGGTLGNFSFTAGNMLGAGDIRGVALADLDGDGDRDAFLAITGGGDQVWINQGGAQLGTLGVFLNSGQSLGSLNSVDVVLGDLDGDGDIDAATAASTTNTVVWRNDGTGVFTQILSISNGGTFVALGDIDADTDLDIITANGAGTGARIIRNTGGGTFNSATVFAGGSLLDVALGDIDSDGDLDVYAANGSSQANKVWFNNGAGTFIDSLQALGNATSHDVAFGDLDLDGDLDAFVADDGPDKVWLNQALVDYGDAPDPSYPTLAASSGAAHNTVPGYYLGTGVDSEANGQPHPFALGDDTAGTDDDNGVVFLDTLFVGVANSVNLTASAPGVLDGWIDLNSDGDWDDAGEKVFVSVPLVAGVNAVNFVVPASATATFATFARFRFSSTGSLTPRGTAINGEVEDYFVPIRELDLGDAAVSSFPTLLAENGARHMLVDGYYLGSGVSAESDGQPDAVGGGDGGDDGVRIVDPLAPGGLATVEVTASAPGLLDAWVDFDDDGQVDVGEQVYVSGLLNAGVNLVSFSVPISANVGDVVFSRFRFSSVGGLSVAGFAPNGEVEDYAVTITNGLRADANSDGGVDAADYTVWRDRLGSSVPLSGPGDNDGDGVVAQSDYALWRANFGASLQASGSAPALSAPEAVMSVAVAPLPAGSPDVALATYVVPTTESNRNAVRPHVASAKELAFAQQAFSRRLAGNRLGVSALRASEGGAGSVRSRDLLLRERVMERATRPVDELEFSNRDLDDQAAAERVDLALDGWTAEVLFPGRPH